MRFRDKNMRKGNLTNWIAVLCLAAAGMPAAAQQSPSVLTRVRSLLAKRRQNRRRRQLPLPNRPRRRQRQRSGTRAGRETCHISGVTGTRAELEADGGGNRADQSAFGAGNEAGIRAGCAERPSRVDRIAWPVHTQRETADQDRGGRVPGAKGVPAKGLKPEAAKSKLISTTPNPKAAAEAKAEAPKDVPRDIPKADALPAIVPVKENIARRDPFSPLLAKEAAGNGTPLNLPPGKPGLMIGSLHIDGIVNGPNGMIAIVSNPQQRVYFLREGDHLYDGQVEHITMDGISFHQTGKDPFGNAVEREVAKRLNPTVQENSNEDLLAGIPAERADSGGCDARAAYGRRAVGQARDGNSLFGDSGRAGWGGPRRPADGCARAGRWAVELSRDAAERSPARGGGFRRSAPGDAAQYGGQRLRARAAGASGTISAGSGARGDRSGQPPGVLRGPERTRR